MTCSPLPKLAPSAWQLYFTDWIQQEQVDGVPFQGPMATAEGTLITSTLHGTKVLNPGGSVTTVLAADAMTRGPAIDFPSIVKA
jgi:hydroxymethylglutaryl-CoA reductase